MKRQRKLIRAARWSASFPSLVRLLLALGLLTVMTGCGTIGDMLGSSEPVVVPATLKPFEPVINPIFVWQTNAGAGSKKLFIKLRATVAANSVYAADSKGDVNAYDAGTGEQIWTTPLKLPLSGGPGVGDGLVTVGTSQGDVVALDLKTGQERWRVKVSSEVLSSPVSGMGVTAVRTSDGKLIVLANESGATLWVYDRNVPVLSLRGTSSPLIIGDGVIAGFDNGRLVALTMDKGQVAWERRLATPRGRTELQRMVDIDADPVLAGNELFAVSFQGRMAALDPRNGEIIWERDMSSHSGMSIGASAVYVTDENSHVWALDRRTGATLWKQTELEHRRLTAPVLQDTSVVVGDFEGYLHWLDVEDGRIVGRIRVDSDGLASAPVPYQKTLIFLGRGGRLGAVSSR